MKALIIDVFNAATDLIVVLACCLLGGVAAGFFFGAAAFGYTIFTAITGVLL